MAAVQSPPPHTQSTPRSKATSSSKHPNPNTSASSSSQNKLFKSISKFLSGHGKSRPKLQQQGSSAPAQASLSAGMSSGGTPAPEVMAGTGKSLARSTSTDGVSVTSSSITNSEGPSRHHHRLSVGDDGASGISGADTDASIRPISPNSLAPSSIVSTSGNTNRTFKSYASTKPTTLLSIDSGGGANRIAVVPPNHVPSSSTTGGGRGGRAYGHSSTRSQDSTGAVGGFLGGSTGLSNSISGVSLASSGGGGGANGISFSALPSSSPPSPPPELDTETPSSPRDADEADLDLSTTQVPRHTILHPRNNPHPASPPPDNASMLTLASSSFAPSFFRSPPPASTTSATGGSGGGSYILSGLRARLGVGNTSLAGDREADEDASVRALAGSRRPSEESLGSRSTWSAAVLNNNVKGDRASVRTVATGGTGDLFATSGGGGHGNDSGSINQGETAAQELVRKEGEGDKEKSNAAAAAALAENTMESKTEKGKGKQVAELDAVAGQPFVTPTKKASFNPDEDDSTPMALGKDKDASSFVSGLTGTDAASFQDAESGRSVD